MANIHWDRYKDFVDTGLSREEYIKIGKLSRTFAHKVQNISQKVLGKDSDARYEALGKKKVAELNTKMGITGVANKFLQMRIVNPDKVKEVQEHLTKIAQFEQQCSKPTHWFNYSEKKEELIDQLRHAAFDNPGFIDTFFAFNDELEKSQASPEFINRFIYHDPLPAAMNPDCLVEMKAYLSVFNEFDEERKAVLLSLLHTHPAPGSKEFGENITCFKTLQKLSSHNQLLLLYLLAKIDVPESRRKLLFNLSENAGIVDSCFASMPTNSSIEYLQYLLMKHPSLSAEKLLEHLICAATVSNEMKSEDEKKLLNHVLIPLVFEAIEKGVKAEAITQHVHTLFSYAKDLQKKSGYSIEAIGEGMAIAPVLRESVSILLVEPEEKKLFQEVFTASIHLMCRNDKEREVAKFFTSIVTNKDKLPSKEELQFLQSLFSELLTMQRKGYSPAMMTTAILECSQKINEKTVSVKDLTVQIDARLRTMQIGIDSNNFIQSATNNPCQLLEQFLNGFVREMVGQEKPIELSHITDSFNSLEVVRNLVQNKTLLILFLPYLNASLQPQGVSLMLSEFLQGVETDVQQVREGKSSQSVIASSLPKIAKTIADPAFREPLQRLSNMLQARGDSILGAIPWVEKLLSIPLPKAVVIAFLKRLTLSPQVKELLIKALDHNFATVQELLKAIIKNHKQNLPQYLEFLKKLGDPEVASEEIEKEFLAIAQLLIHEVRETDLLTAASSGLTQIARNASK